MIIRLLLSCFLLGLAIAPGADRLFVFDGQSESAVVLDAGSLARLAQPRVGLGGSAAFLDRSRGAARYWTVGTEAVTLLDERLEALTAIQLEGLGQASPPAAFAPALARLVVAAGSRLYLIDTDEVRLDTTIDTEFGIAAVALRPGSGQAWLLEAGASRLWSVDLTSGVVSSEASGLPSVAEALATSPGGLAALAASGSGAYDLASLPTGIGGGSSVEAGGAILAIGDSGAAVWSIGGELRLVNGDGPAIPLTDPSSGQPLTSAEAAAVSSNGEAVFTALADGRLLRLGKPGTQADQMFLASAASALALTPDPVNQTTPNLEAVAGGGQQVVSGEEFFLTVQNNLGTGMALTTTVSPPGAATCEDTQIGPRIVLQPPPTAVVTCTAADVTQTQSISVTVAGTFGSATFSGITITAPCANGLTAVSPMNQSLVAGSSLDLTVQVCEAGSPKDDVNLTISESGAGLSCPSQDTTGANGRATFSCDADDVDVETEVTVTVSDGTDEVDFIVTISPLGQVFDTLEKDFGDLQVVSENTQFTLRVRTLRGGAPRVGVSVAVVESNGAAVCANPAPTSGTGRATITCEAQEVAGNQNVQITATEGGRSVIFSVTILNGVQGNGLTILSGNNQIVGANTNFPQPLIVSSTVNGTPKQFEQLTVQPDSGAAFCNNIVVTDSSGIASITCTATGVQSVTEVAIQVTDSVANNLDDPFRATIIPGSVGSADSLDVLTPSLSGQAGQTLQDGVRVRARNGGELAAGVPVFFSSTQDLTFEPPVVTTNLSGNATTDVTIGCTTGSGTIQVGLTQGAADATIPFTALPGPLSVLEKSSGDMQSIGSGLIYPVALLLRTTDLCGAPIPNQPVTWSVIPPNAAELVTPGQVSNGQGRVSTRVRAGIIGGDFTVRAVSGAVQTDFTLTVTNTPSTLEAFSGGGQSIPAGQAAPLPVIARVLNEQGQPVQGISVDFRVVSGDATVAPLTATTNAQGQASATVTAGGAIGPVVIEASAINRTVNFNLTVVGGVPMVPIEGFVNGASFRSGFSPGATGSIFGTGIVSDPGVHVAPFPFPTVFRGVEVRINGVSAPILALINVNGQEQINIQVPFEIQASTTATVVIINNGSQASFSGIPIFQTQPGIFEVTLGNSRFAAALDADFQLIEPSNPVPPGGVVQLFVTGLGPLNPPVATNEVGPIPPAEVVGAVTVGLNGQGIPILGAFYAPGFVTLYQVNFFVPANLPPGQYQVSIVVGGVGSQNVTLVVGN